VPKITLDMSENEHMTLLEVLANAVEEVVQEEADGSEEYTSQELAFLKLVLSQLQPDATY